MFTSINLKINCGFARVAMFELKDTQPVDRAAQYKSLFPNFKFQDYYFRSRTSGSSTFDDNCKAIVRTINKKWTELGKERYLSFFSSTNWRLLTDTSKEKHSLASCDGCSRMHSDYQRAYPGKPFHEPPPQIVSLPENSSATEKEECHLVLKELNEQWTERYQHTLFQR